MNTVIGDSIGKKSKKKGRSIQIQARKKTNNILLYCGVAWHGRQYL